MSALVLAAEGEIRPGEHWTGELGGFTFHLDTIIGTVIAGALVCGLGIYMARGATKGRPTFLQLAFEGLTGWVQTQLKDQMGLRTPRGVIALCVALFAFILICNWMAALPIEHYLPPPTADVNLVYPLMLLVIVWVNVAGIRANGVKGYFGHLTKPYVALAPIEFITLYFSRRSRSPSGCGATSSPAGSWSRSSRCCRSTSPGCRPGSGSCSTCSSA